MPKRTEKLLTEVAQPIAEKLAKRSSVKLILSAGVLALNDQSAENRELYLDLANGVRPNELLAKQRQKELIAIFESIEGDPGLSAPQKKKLSQAFELLQDLFVNKLARQGKKASKSA